MPISSFSFDAVLVIAEAAAPAAAAPGAGGFGPAGGQILFMGLLFAAMWFLLIAPQRKKQKEHEKLLKELKSGDDVVTTGGIYGTIVTVKDDRFVIRIGDNTKVEIGKGFIHGVDKKSSA